MGRICILNFWIINMGIILLGQWVIRLRHFTFTIADARFFPLRIPRPRKLT